MLSLPVALCHPSVLPVAGATLLHFEQYRERSVMDSVHDSDTESGSEGVSHFSAGMQSRASKKLAGTGPVSKILAGFHKELKKSAVDDQALNPHKGFADFSDLQICI